MRITSKGQVTIPLEIRKKFGLMPDSEVEFRVHRDLIQLRKAPSSSRRGRQVIQALHRAKPHIHMTTDQILALTRGE